MSKYIGHYVLKIITLIINNLGEYIMLNTEQLDFFKEALENRKEQIKKNLNTTTTEMNSLNTNELKDEADHASTSLGRAVDNAI